MTIDKKQLVELLVEKTSMNREDINTQLDQLIERILDAAKRGKALEIKEFGVFYFNEEGKLRFDPADELSTEISFKYAGMKPVEIKPERDTSIPKFEEEIEDEVERDEEEDPFGESFDEYEDEEDEPGSGLKKDDEIDWEEEEEAPFDFGDDLEDEAASGEHITDDPFSSETFDPVDEPAEKEEEATNAKNLKPISRQPVKRKDNTGVFVLIAIVLVAVLIGGYFYYVNTQSQSQADSAQSSSSQLESGISESENNANTATEIEPTDSLTNNTQGAVDNQEMAADNQSSTEQPTPIEGTDGEMAPNTTVSASETNQPMYGLNGSVIEGANNGYSIVVHSFRTEETAVGAADQLRAEGYRVIVSSRTVYENLVWRVSIGQFETLSAAQQATTRLPEPYSTQNFIQRIRTN